MADDDHPDDEAELFRHAMRDVEPQRLTKRESWKRKPKPLPLPNRDDDPLELDDVEVRDTPTFLEFRRPGIQDRVFRDLSRGVIPVQASVDLHGMRVAEARSTLARFLQQSLAQRRHCVRIVHGKGFGSEHQPVLKQNVNQWLRQRPEVLAFCSAPRWDGGTGATYVLLSRKHRRS